jgi:glucose/arabinose dehydrogenase
MTGQGSLGPLVVDTLARGLVAPWDIDFAPDGRVFVTERPGRVRIVEEGVLRSLPWAELEIHAEGEAGLMGIALSPDFQETGHVFVLATSSRLGSSALTRVMRGVYRRLVRPLNPDAAFPYVNRVYRLKDRDGRGEDATVVIDGLPAHLFHVGGALDFGPDGHLYLTLGDSGTPDLAQSDRSLLGSVMRFTTDGGTPADNPDPTSPVFAMGLRNPQGLAWHPGTGELFATEHGPADDDELNLVLERGNYGWPWLAGYGQGSGLTPPLIAWNPGIAPSGLAVVQLHAPELDAFIGGLGGRRLQRVVLQRSTEGSRPWSPACQEALLVDQVGRIRAARIGPDGNLYLTTSNRDTRGTPDAVDDMVLRISLPRAIG